MAQTKMFCFGPLRVTQGEREVAIGLSKAKALFSYLMVEARPYTREALAALLWPELDGRRARGNLRRTLHHLTKAVGPDLLEMSGDTIGRSSSADVWLDVAAFQQGVDACLDNQTDQTENGQDTLAAAVALYQDDFLAGFTLADSPEFDEWQFFQRETLRRQLARGLIALSTAFQEREEWATAITYTHRWLALDPLHEPAHRHLMQLYALSGQQAAALRQYETCVRILAEELGIAPAEETTAQFERIRTRQFVTAASPLPLSEMQPANRKQSRHNLPVPTTPFIGREQELLALSDALTHPDVRLVTILGPGGIGKTRLALAAAQNTLPASLDGVWFVSLAPLETPEQILTTVADAVGYRFHGTGEMKEQLLGYLQSKQALLLLDNFEHLLAGVDLVAAILRTAPGVKILVTSRERLNLSGETVFTLGGMAYLQWPSTAEAPTDASTIASESARLFLYRAQMVRPNLQLQSADYRHVARICHLVQGMPLALALAAGWAELLSFAEIAAEISQSFDFLESDGRDVPDRQRSVRAAFTYSWQQLSEEEQQVFQKLSVFRGGFTRQAALAVAGATVRTLRTLANKSFLSLARQGRYEVHELLRQYGADRLAQDPAAVTHIANSHSRYYARFLDERLEDVQTLRRREPLLEINQDLDNIRTAWRWAVSHSRTDDLAVAAASFFYYCQTQSYFAEGEASLDAAIICLRALPATAERDVLLARILTYQGWLCLRLGQLARARAALEESIALYHACAAIPPSTMGSEPRTTLGVLELVVGNYQAAAALGQEVYRLSETRRDAWNLMFACYVLTNASLALGHYVPAEAYAQQAYGLSQQLEAPWFMAYILNDLGNLAHATGHFEMAGSYYQQGYDLREAQADPEGMALALNLLGKNAAALGDTGQAQALYQRAAAIYREINDRGGLATSLNGLGQTEQALGQLEIAREHFRQALNIATEINFLPLLCAILIPVAELLLGTGSAREGLAALSLASRHPATEYVTRVQAQQKLTQYRDRLPPNALEQVLCQGEEGDLDTAVAKLLRLLTLPENDNRAGPLR